MVYVYKGLGLVERQQHEFTNFLLDISIPVLLMKTSWLKFPELVNLCY